MKNRMELSVKKSLIALLGAVTLMAAMPQSADATGTRVWTLGAMNRFIEDDANRWLYPHTISKYSNLYYLELYGMADSMGANAPTAMRGANDNWALSLAGFENNTALTGHELIPLQSTAGGGAIIKLMDDLFLSLHLSDYENPIVKSFLEGPFAGLAGGSPSSFAWINSNPPTGLEAANRKFDVTAAYNVIPDFLTAGLSLSFGSSSYIYNPNDNDPPLFEGTDDELARATDNIGTSETRLLLGVGVDLSEAIALDIAAGFGFHGLTYLPNNRADLITGGTGSDIQFDARGLLGLTDQWEVVPALSWRSGSFSATDLANLGDGLSYNNVTPPRDQTNESDVTVTWSSLDLGVAGHFKPADHVDFWLATGFQVASAEYKYLHLVPEDPNASPAIVRDSPLEESSLALSKTVLPYLKTGLEAKVFSWLDLRAGVVKFVSTDKMTTFQVDDQTNDNARNNDTTVDRPFFDYFLGLAAHYEGLFLDLQLDPEWIRRGPNFLSGAQGNMFLNASLGYNF